MRMEREGRSGDAQEASASGTRPRGADEALGELPWSYAVDVLMALPRDPWTLFVYWDHAPDVLRRAQDVEAGRTELRVFARDDAGRFAHVRTVEFGTAARSAYVPGLEPGRVYRAELHVVLPSGEDRLLLPPSNEMMLPTTGPSPVIDDRFMRILWGEILHALLREPRSRAPARPSSAELPPLAECCRFAGRVWGGGMSAVPPGERPSSPEAPWRAR